MKKSLLFCAIALSLGFAACDDELPNPPAQQYPQPEIFDAAGLVVSQGNYGVGDPMDLNTYAEKGESVPVLDITSLTNFPEDYTLVVPMEIGSDADFTKVATVSTTVVDNVVYATPGAITDAIREVVSKSPAAVTVNVRFPAFAETGTSTMELGGLNYYYFTGEYQFLPYQTYVVEDEYYLVGNFCGWNLNQGLKMNRVNPEGSVYDNPVFTVKFDVTDAQAAADGFQYKIVPASAVAAGSWEGTYGVAPKFADVDGVTTEQREGSLVVTDEAEAEHGTVAAAGPYLLTVNFETQTYSYSLAVEYLYVAGNGTSQTDFKKMAKLYTTDFVNYQGAAGLNRQWWLAGQESWTGLVYYLADDTEETFDGLYTSGLLQNNGKKEGVSMKINEKGLYWINANLVTLEYKTTHLETLGVVGNFQGWKEKEPVALTPDKNFTVWTATVALDGEFKINANGAWDIDFGSTTSNIGTPNALDYKGGNMSVAAGTYEVKVDFTALPYTLTLTAK